MEGFKAKQVKLSEFEVLNTLGTGMSYVPIDRPGKNVSELRSGWRSIDLSLAGWLIE